MTTEDESEGKQPAGSYVECGLAEFLDLVGQRRPAPGGGSVAAITVALAAALTEMAARFSVDHLSAGGELVDSTERLRRRAGELADLDALVYPKVIAAYAREDDQDPARRRNAIRTALRGASDVPLEIAEVGAETATLAARLVVDGLPSLRGDAATGLLLAEAAVRAAAHLVSVNVQAGGLDRELVHRAERSVDVARAAASDLHPDEDAASGRHRREE